MSSLHSALIEMTRARTAVFDIAVKDRAGVALDITGMELEFAATTALGQEPLFTKDSLSSEAGITVTNASGGLATLEIAPEDTESLTAKTVLFFELVLDSGGRRYSVASGKLTVLLGAVVD